MRVLSFAISIAMLGVSTTAHAAANIVLPEGPGRNLVYGECQTCHDLKYLEESKGISARAWNDILDTMHEFGLRVDDPTRARLYDYLSTYLGPKPPAEQPAVASEPAATDGAAVFADNCAGCHQETAEGVPGQFPPLAGNTDLFLDHLFPPTVVLNGLQGPLEVSGGTYGEQQMPSFDYLTENEIAAVINFLWSDFGNQANRPSDWVDLTAEEVARLRETPMPPADVHALRASYLK